MKNIIKKLAVTFFILIIASNAKAWIGEPMPRLHVDGRYLKDTMVIL